ncbi:hypothetical protein [Sphingomonas azotifigens]|uniref:hypothetical protein n=1 Tax=Sphingomonas azotifigens TaxID=330920 RepID=UPI0014306EAB
MTAAAWRPSRGHHWPIPADALRSERPFAELDKAVLRRAGRRELSANAESGAPLEEMPLDERSGRIMRMSLADCHVPVHRDVPDIDLLWTDIPDPAPRSARARSAKSERQGGGSGRQCGVQCDGQVGTGPAPCARQAGLACGSARSRRSR